jgi:YHS domain-containing protein
MTAARQERKARNVPAKSRGTIMAMIVARLVFAAVQWAVPPLLAATTERVVINRHTGLAIDGFDPVAYFTDGAPSLGRSRFEVRHAGATWRFRNEGNRAAFAADPEVYMPRFGGYDPIAAARGVAVPGHPSLWLIAEGRLYLFYSDEARAQFAEDPEQAIDAAERHWPEVVETLVP